MFDKLLKWAFKPGMTEVVSNTVVKDATEPKMEKSRPAAKEGPLSVEPVPSEPNEIEQIPNSSRWQGVYDEPVTKPKPDQVHHHAHIVLDSGSAGAKVPGYLSYLTAGERRTLYALMGNDYVPTSYISEAQIAILRLFSGFTWSSKEIEYWKNELQTAASDASREFDENSENEAAMKTPLLKPQTNPTNSFSRSDLISRSVPDQTVQEVSRPKIVPYVESTEPESLNAEQQRVFDYIENTSSNLFITGRAGSGKSFLLRYLLGNSSKRVLPVAFMGVAALNIGGTTIHSAFQLPLKLLLPTTGRQIADRLTEDEREFYREYRVLIVDEISMVAADQFVAMDEFLRSVNEADIPFGGVQVILFGDPYQLPPVVERNGGPEFYSDQWGDPYFFSTESWRKGGFLKIQLQGSERQTNQDFLRLLDSMRVGNLSDQEFKLLNTRVVPESQVPDTGSVRVCSTNMNADRYNSLRLNLLPGRPFEFLGQATGEYRKNWNRLPAPMRLQIKQNAQIIMVKNDMGRRWMNGSVGTIAEIGGDKIIVEINGLKHEVEQANWDKETHTYNRSSKVLTPDAKSEYKQYPIDLGWARTVHKSQGQTFDQCVVDLTTRMFAEGQAYVACSRTKTLDGLYLTAPLTRSSVKTSNAVRRFMSDLLQPSDLAPF